ncbi:hypothetical protein [Nocardioides flavescens]|uniref:DUF3558 domain-containing protein n=1 Tax=Nocardioides flavescens TaxID=2691959 RepID=A0A6L7ESD4_9ACTN|nr:hypothetical protein [Nocardioides flavescens]MXG88448.1 hypothetical protein [Nocardioides flavescens]
MRLRARSLAVVGVVTVLVTAALVVAGVVLLGDGPDEADREAAATPFTITTLAELGLDPTSVGVTRGPFCDEVDPREVEAALGSEPADATAWQNGDPVPLRGGAQDVGHEFGCSWTGADGTVASAWVFAPPVDATRAAQLAQDTDAGWCTQPSPAPAFGTSGTSLDCFGQGNGYVAYRGLFGDAWLTCRVEAPPADPAAAPLDPTGLEDRADRWCAGILRSVSSTANS